MQDKITNPKKYYSVIDIRIAPSAGGKKAARNSGAACIFIMNFS